jgi:hypothetical protein
MNKQARIIGAVAALALGISGANGAARMKPVHKPAAANTVQAPAGYGVMLGINRVSYQVSQAQAGSRAAQIHATLTLFNHTSTPLNYTEHGRQFEWQIVDAQGNIVWDYAKGRAFPHFVMRRMLTEGQQDFAADIPLTTQDGKPLPAGNYTLRGELATEPIMKAEVGFAVSSD